MEEIRRDDGELCGYVVHTSTGWESRTMFGATLRVHPSPLEAADHLREHGLSVLTELWLYRADLDEDSEGEVARIVEASPAGVTIVVDYFAMPGAPRVTLTPDDIIAGRLRIAE